MKQQATTILAWIFLCSGISCWGTEAAPVKHKAAPRKTQLAPMKKGGPANVKILQIIQGEPRTRRYPYALSSLLRHINEETTARMEVEPDIAKSFEDPVIFKYPFIYVNAGDCPRWELSDTEQRNLKKYLERGGFLFVDAGISASFLRGNPMAGQHHSFAEWEETPDIRKAFKTVFPTKRFKPLKRDHALYRSFYKGLPDPKDLPDSVREFVIKEKWPEGTYSGVGLTVKGRLAVLCTPIIAMGWGKDQLGNWMTTIGFRIREGAKDLDKSLAAAAYSGESFETRREDGEMDIIYCQPRTKPAWVKEPSGRWRIFRFYHSREISEFAHVFYTQLGTNIVVHALMH